MTNFLHYLLVFLPVVCFAQPMITTSPSFEVDSKGTVSMVGLLATGANDNMLAVYRASKRGSRLGLPKVHNAWAADVFSPDMEKVKSNALQELELPKGEEANLDFAIVHGGRPWLILQHYEKKPKGIGLYRCPIDPEGKIGSPEKIGNYPIEKKSELRSKFVLYSASDGSGLLFTYAQTDWNFRDPVSFITFDKDWNKRQSGYLNLPKRGTDLRMDNPCLGKDGSIWMPAWTELNKGGGIAQEIWVWQDPKSEPKRIDVQLDPDKLITKMKLRQSTTDGMFYVCGAYAQASKKALKSIPRSTLGLYDKHNEQGSFFLKIDPQTHTILSKHTSAFPTYMFVFFKVDEKEVRKGDGINLLSVKDIVPQTDGSVWFSLEQGFITPSSVRGTTGALNTDNHYATGSAIILRYGPDGHVQTDALIKKQLMSVNGSGNGHVLIPNAGKALLLYNDHQENISTPPQSDWMLKLCRVADVEGIPMGQSAASTAMYYLNEDGSGKPKALFNFKETQYWFDPMAWIQLSPTRYIVGCDGRNGHYGLIRIDMPD